MITHSTPPKSCFTGIILAADRGSDDPVTRVAGVSCKALTPVGGVPMVLRVLNALAESQTIDQRILCGPPRAILEQASALKSGVDSGDYDWIENRNSPSASASAALEQVPDSHPVLLTTADHALLSSEVVDYFCDQAGSSDYDLMIALASHELVAEAYPGVRRTRLRFSDQDYCSCNLFAFLTPRSRKIANFWRKLESQRKRPWRIFAELGWWPVCKYLFGRLSLQEALARVSYRFEMKIGVVVLPFANAAIDVDKESDWQLVQRILAEKEPLH